MTDDELDLVDTELLVDTLGRRFKGCLVVTVREHNGGGDGATTYWRGGWVQAVGLARFAEFDILGSPKMTKDRRDT